MNSALQKSFILTGAVVVVICLVVGGTLIGAAVYGWRAAQRAGAEAATLQELKTVAQSEAEYFNSHNRTFATFDRLVKEGFLSKRFEGNRPTIDGYVFTLSLGNEPNHPASSYTLTADPLSDARHFYIDSNTGGVHVNSISVAGPNDPIVGR